MIIGTLGCFVQLSDGRSALLSNNHVVAAENRGKRDDDRILQPGSSQFSSDDHGGDLRDFVELRPTPSRAGRRDRIYNDVDAGIATIPDNVRWAQRYMPHRPVPSPSGIGIPQIGDAVFKVGRTTGLTFGEIVDIGTIVGPVGYAVGDCWFRRSMTIRGNNGALFSDKGDSGSAIVRMNGDVVGLLYAGNGSETYACRIDAILEAFDCTLA